MTYLYTGLRRSELIYLNWADVNLEKKFISVTPKPDWHPKDFEIRHIPVNGPLLAELKKNTGAPDQPVFPTSRGRRYIPSALSREIRKVFKKAGIKGADIKTLRHTFASHLVMNGADLYTVQKLLGHSSVKTTERYAHLAPDFLHTAVDKLKF